MNKPALAVVKESSHYFPADTKKILTFLRTAKKSKNIMTEPVVFSVVGERLQLTFAGMNSHITLKLEDGQPYQFPVGVPLEKLWKAVQGAKKANRLTLSWDDKRFYIDGNSMRHSLYCNTDVRIHEPRTIYADTSIPPDIFRESLPTLLKTISRNSPRSYGSAVKFYLNRDKGVFGLVGTDGYRLSYSEHKPKSENLGQLEKAVLPYDACQQILEIARAEDDIKMGISEDSTCLSVVAGESLFCWFRLSSVKYPNWLAVIPKNHGQNVACFDRKAFLEKAKKAATTTDKSETVMITTGEQALLLHTKDETNVENTYNVPLESLTGRVEKLMVNGRFLVDCLVPSKEKTGQIHFPADSENPIEIRLGSVKTIIVPIIERD